jgi:hypothetical protein
MVRLADVGPVSAGFWRLALAVPFLAFVAVRQSRGRPFPGWALIARCGARWTVLRRRLAAWHEGILRTRLANATLFGNFASFLFAIYGFVLLRSCPAGRRVWRCCSPRPARPPARAQLRALATPFHRRPARLARRPLLHFLPDRGGPDAAGDAPWPVLAIATAAGALPILLFSLALGRTGDAGRSGRRSSSCRSAAR